MQDIHVKLNPGLPRQKQHSRRKRLFTSKVDSDLRKKLVQCYIWSIASCDAETWTLRQVDRKCLKSFEVWCWRRTEKIRRTDCVRNEILQRVKKERNNLHIVKRSKANWTGNILCRNCLLLIKHVIEGRREGTERRGRRHKQLMYDLREMRRYWKLKEEGLCRTLWGNRFGRGPTLIPWSCFKDLY